MNKKRAFAEIDINKLRNNLAIIKKYIHNDIKIGAVVKGDAYGHGMGEIVKELSRDIQIQFVLVGTEEEAIKLNQLNYPIPILILENIFEPEWDILMEYDFIFSAYNMIFLRKAEIMAKKMKKIIRVHIRIDIANTGMGFNIFDFTAHQKEIFEMKHILVEGIYSHLYSSYSFQRNLVLKELNEFAHIVNRLPEEIRQKLTIHVCNSALLFEYPEYHFDMVRIGSAFYGLLCNPENSFDLQPIMSLKSKIFSITQVNQEQNISYFPSSRDIQANSRKVMKIARISLGYWDAPLLMNEKNVKVWAKGKLYSLVGEPCMDNACIDISESNHLKIGDTVILIGDKPGIYLKDIVKRHNIPIVHSERIGMLSGRISKKYIG